MRVNHQRVRCVLSYMAINTKRYTNDLVQDFYSLYSKFFLQVKSNPGEKKGYI